MFGSFHEFWCDECGVEITWRPVVIGHRNYCCHDCAVGLECACDSINPGWEEDAEFIQRESFERSDPSYDRDYVFD